MPRRMWTGGHHAIVQGMSRVAGCGHSVVAGRGLTTRVLAGRCVEHYCLHRVPAGRGVEHYGLHRVLAGRGVV